MENPDCHRISVGASSLDSCEALSFALSALFENERYRKPRRKYAASDHEHKYGDDDTANTFGPHCWRGGEFKTTKTKMKSDEQIQAAAKGKYIFGHFFCLIPCVPSTLFQVFDRSTGRCLLSRIKIGRILRSICRLLLLCWKPQESNPPFLEGKFSILNAS